MAKYVVEIPEDTTCLNALRYEDGKCVSARSYIIPDLTPYVKSESYIDGLKEGQNDAWEFVRKMISKSGNEVSEMWGCATNFGEVMRNTTYSEAKAKYEAWKKEKEEIHIGDEVQYSLAGYEYTFIVFGKENDTLYGMRTDKVDMDDICEIWEYCYKSDSTLVKTGRHFDEVSNLMERIRKNE